MGRVQIKPLTPSASNPDLERSTAMFGRLANPSGANDALSQVLYGLALRSVTPYPSLLSFPLSLFLSLPHSLPSLLPLTT